MPKSKEHRTASTSWEFGLMAGLVLIVSIIMVRAQLDFPSVLRAQHEAQQSLIQSDERFPVLDTLFQSYDPNVLADLRPDTTDANRWVDSMMSTLTLDQKMGQLFILHLPTSGGRPNVRRAIEAVEDYNIGGFLVSRALEPQDVYEAVREIQDASDVPLFFTADFERGVGRHSNNLTEWPANMAVGATRDPAFAAAAGRLTAIEGRGIGVNMILAPVVDVNNNPENPIINIRSYGEDPRLVGEMAAAFVYEAQTHGMLTTLKHFPGHGNTSVDTHTRMGKISGNRAMLNEVELYPYRKVLADASQPTAVMTAHLWIQALDQDPLPATFSKNALHELLRDTLQFGGLVVTDDVKMGALYNNYSLSERTVNPLLAGADLVLTPRSIGRSLSTVRSAIQDADLNLYRLDRSVRRILRAKANAGLHNRSYPKRANVNYLLSQPRGEVLARTAADDAITLLKNERVLPLRTAQQVVLLQMTNQAQSPSIVAAMDRMAEQLRSKVKLTDMRVDYTPSAGEMEEVLIQAANADVVVIAMYLRIRAGRGDPGLFPKQQELAQALVDRLTPTVLVTLGNPYAVTPFTDAEALLVAYEQSMASVVTVDDILKGHRNPAGKLPITVGPFAYGSGLEMTGPPMMAQMAD